MSAVPAVETYVEPVAPLTRSRVAHTAVATVPVVLPRKRARIRSRALDLSSILSGAATFLLVTGLVAFVLSLAGNVMVEKARQGNREAYRRARLASRDSAALRSSVQALTSARAVEGWALANGFAAPEAAFAPSAH